MALKCPQINRNLLYLKMSYFLVSTVRISTLPYVSLFSAQIVSFNELAIIFSLVPITSIFSPIVIGFIADRTGQFKVMLIICLLLAAGAHTTVLWLYRATTDPASSVYDVAEPSSLGHLSWNGSSLQLSTFNSSDVSPGNVSVWLDVVSCHLLNGTDHCLHLAESLDKIQLNRVDQWQVDDQLAAQLLNSCTELHCSVSIGNATASAASGWTRRFAFPVLFVVRMMGYVFLDALNPLMDATGLYMCKKYRGDFARQKMWSMGSIVCISILCGSLIDLSETLLGYKEYGVAFAIGAMAALAMIPLVGQLDVQVAKNKESMLSTLVTAGKMCDVSVFFLVEVVIGFCWGFHINFFPIYLDVELQASKTLLAGMAISANGIGAMIVMAVATKIINRWGPCTTVAASLLFVLVRFTSLYFLRTVWLVLLLELVDGLCGFFALLAGSYFCAAAAPSGMLASFNGILSAAFFGAGRGLGSSIGSAVISAFGIRTAYLAFGIAAGVTSLVYLSVYHGALKKHEQRRLQDKKSRETANGIENPAIDQREEPSTQSRAS